MLRKENPYLFDSLKGLTIYELPLKQQPILLCDCGRRYIKSYRRPNQKDCYWCIENRERNMIEITKITGRLGNQMFEFAALYSVARDRNIDVYMQDPQHFEKYEKQIREIYTQGIGMIPEVGIHFRRGDYVNHPFYVDLSKTDYYEKAIALFPHQRDFFIFSDDIPFARTFFTSEKWPDKHFFFSEGLSEVEDLNLLASCSSQIIANSSFSWWAAYLCLNEDKKVVAPSVEHWHPDGIERTKCPLEWIRL